MLVTSVPLVNPNGSLEYMITTVRNMAQLRQPPPAEREQSLDQAELDLTLHSLGLVYRSQAMRQVVELAARVADTDATVTHHRGDGGG